MSRRHRRRENFNAKPFINNNKLYNITGSARYFTTVKCNFTAVIDFEGFLRRGIADIGYLRGVNGGQGEGKQNLNTRLYYILYESTSIYRQRHRYVRISSIKKINKIEYGGVFFYIVFVFY